jgi:hypothetical protein
MSSGQNGQRQRGRGPNPVGSWGQRVGQGGLGAYPDPSAPLSKQKLDLQGSHCGEARRRAAGARWHVAARALAAGEFSVADGCHMAARTPPRQRGPTARAWHPRAAGLFFAWPAWPPGIRPGAKAPIPGKSWDRANAKASSLPSGGVGLTRAQSFKHKAHPATSRGTFEVFQNPARLPPG